MTSAMTDEELLSMLENSDDDFGSGTDLGEGDSSDDDVDPEWTLPIMQNNTAEQEEDKCFRCTHYFYIRLYVE